jgi:hypothetical protein
MRRQRLRHKDFCMLHVNLEEGLVVFEEPEAHQLGSHAVGRLEGAGVEKVVVAPIVRLAVLLVRVVHVQQRQVIPCAATPAAVMLCILSASPQRHNHTSRGCCCPQTCARQVYPRQQADE